MKRLNDNQEQQAQRMACTHLVHGCENAISNLALATDEAANPSMIGLRAQDILAEVLASWRDVAEAMRPLESPQAATPVANTLDGWTSDELFAEVVERGADNTPALRMMQGLVVKAQLAAHDRASARIDPGSKAS